MALGQLGDVHQALDALLDPDERTERHQLGDLAGHHLPMAWVRAKCRHGSSWVALSDSETRSRSMSTSSTSTVTSSPTCDGTRRVVVCFQDSSETCTGRRPAGSTNAPKLTIEDDDALADRALDQLVEELAADLGLGLLEPGAAGQHHVVAVLVQLDDLGLDLLADVRLQIADAAHLDQGRRAAGKPRRPMSRISRRP